MQKVILGGGGNDSARLMEENTDAVVLVVNYGQESWWFEKDACLKIANALGMNVVTMDLSKLWLGSGNKFLLGTAESDDEAVVPFRNGILVSAAAGWAMDVFKDEKEIYIYLGIHATIKKGGEMADCTNEWAVAMNKAVELGTGGVCHLKTPYSLSLKRDIICSKRIRPLLYSCYKGVKGGCGVCSKCKTLAKYKDV